MVSGLRLAGTRFLVTPHSPPSLRYLVAPKSFLQVSLSRHPFFVETLLTKRLLCRQNIESSINHKVLRVELAPFTQVKSRQLQATKYKRKTMKVRVTVKLSSGRGLLD